MSKQMDRLIRILVVFLVFYCFWLGLLLAIGVPSGFVGVLRFTKEGLMFLLIALAALSWRKFENRGFNLLDKVVIGLFILSTVYLIFFSTVDVPEVAKLSEYRIYLYVCVAYWIGRYCSIRPNEMVNLVRFISLVVLMSAAVSVLNQAVLNYSLSNIADLYRTSYTFAAEVGEDVLSFQGLAERWGGVYLRIRDMNGSYLDLGNYLVFASFAYLGLFYFFRKRRYFVLFVAGMVILLLSGARAAAATMAVIGLVVAAIRLKKPFLTLGILSVGIIVFASVTSLRETFLNAMASGLDLSNRAGHIGGWYFMIQSFIENPNGYGFGVGERTASTFGTSRYMTGFDSSPAHYVGNMGFLGGAIWLASVTAVLFMAVRLRKSDPSREVQLVAFMVFYLGVSYFLISLTKYIDSSYDVVFPFWILVGWASARSRFSWMPNKKVPENQDPEQLWPVEM